jgi:hypothetical protein
MSVFRGMNRLLHSLLDFIDRLEPQSCLMTHGLRVLLFSQLQSYLEESCGEWFP